MHGYVDASTADQCLVGGGHDHLTSAAVMSPMVNSLCTPLVRFALSSQVGDSGFPSCRTE
jgi:hypothetical protein